MKMKNKTDKKIRKMMTKGEEIKESIDWSRG